MFVTSTNASVQHDDPLGKLVLLGILRSYMLSGGRVSVADLHSQFMEVYGHDVMSRQQVAKWGHTFASGQDNVTHDKQNGT